MAGVGLARLGKELKMLTDEPPPGVCAWPVEDCITHLQAREFASPIIHKVFRFHNNAAVCSGGPAAVTAGGRQSHHGAVPFILPRGPATFCLHRLVES